MDTTTRLTPTIQTYLASAGRFENAVSGLTEAQLDLSLAPGEWSIRQAIHPVASDGDVWSMCIQKTLASPGVGLHFEGFPGNEAWAAALDHHRRPVAPALQLIHAHIQFISSLVECYPERANCTMKIIDENGKAVAEFSVIQIVTFLGEHLVEHAQTIERIREMNHL